MASESAGGLVLATAAVLALIASNSALGPTYQAFVQLHGEVRIAGDWLVLSKPLLLWVNDLWMSASASGWCWARPSVCSARPGC